MSLALNFLQRQMCQNEIPKVTWHPYTNFMKNFEYTLQIKEHHLDSFGHVNNAVYLALYEEARWELITHNGYGMDEVKKFRQGPVVLDVKVRFRKEMKKSITNSFVFNCMFIIMNLFYIFVSVDPLRNKYYLRH